MEYFSPAITDLGTIREVTLQANNKVGSTPDVFTGITGIVGSIIPFP